MCMICNLMNEMFIFCVMVDFVCARVCEACAFVCVVRL